MTTTASENGRARKSLASEIDRLHEILDALSENLNEAVATAVAGAVKDAMTAAVQEAVHAAVLEVLSNKDLRQRQGVTPTPGGQPPAPGAVRLADTARRCWTWLSEVAQDTWEGVTTVAQMVKVRAVEATSQFLANGRATVRQVCERTATKARAGWVRLLVLARLARQLRRRLPVALGVGVAAGLVVYLAGPLVVPVACGLVVFFGALLVPWETIPRMTTGPDGG
jgi:hypothetical protein